MASKANHIFISEIDLVWSKTVDKINLYNLASNNFITVTEIAKIIIKEMQLKKTHLIYSGGTVGWVGDVPIVRINNQKIRKLGWKNQYTSRQAVVKTVQVLLKNYK